MLKMYDSRTGEIIEVEIVDGSRTKHLGNYWDFLVKKHHEEGITGRTYKEMAEYFDMKNLEYAKEIVQRFNNDNLLSP